MLDANIHTIHNDFNYLIACCQDKPTQKDELSIITYLSSKNFNEDVFITLAYQHGVLPLLYKHIKSLSKENHSLENFLSKVKAKYISIVQRNMLLNSELIKIIQLFKENGIEALSFKGPTLAQMVYGDITLRQYGDIDILIHPKDREKAMRVMQTNNYRPEIILAQRSKKYFFSSVNVLGFYHTSVYVEIHWELLAKNYAISFYEEKVWQSPQNITLSQHTILTLNDEQLLLYLCIHGSKHLYARLEWVCDVDRVIRVSQNLDWNVLLHDARDRGIFRLFLLSLRLSQEFFNTPLPENIQKQISQDSKIPILLSRIIHLRFSDSTSTGGTAYTFLYFLQMREKFSDKILFIIRALLSTKFNDFKWIQLPSYLFFLYPLIRPLRLLIKYLK